MGWEWKQWKKKRRHASWRNGGVVVRLTQFFATHHRLQIRSHDHQIISLKLFWCNLQLFCNKLEYLLLKNIYPCLINEGEASILSVKWSIGTCSGSGHTQKCWA
jgi:hypothetical protein